MKRLFISFEYQPDGKVPDAVDEQSAAEPIFAKILSCLQKEGGAVMSDQKEWESYGWYVEAKAGNATLTCMFQRSDEWLLQIFPKRSLLDRMTGVHHDGEGKAFARAVANAVHEACGVPVPAVQSETEFQR